MWTHPPIASDGIVFKFVSLFPRTARSIVIEAALRRVNEGSPVQKVLNIRAHSVDEFVKAVRLDPVQGSRSILSRVNPKPLGILAYGNPAYRRL